MNIYEPKIRMTTQKLLIGEEEEEEEENEEEKEEEEEEDDDDDEEPLQVKSAVLLSFALLVRPEALHGPREGRAVDRDE